MERSGRKAEDVCIVHVKQGLETNAFASLFSSWDEQKTAVTTVLIYLAACRLTQKRSFNKLLLTLYG